MLSPRLRQIDALNKRGLTNDQIADQLGIKLTTVRVQLMRINQSLKQSLDREYSITLSPKPLSASEQRVYDLALSRLNNTEIARRLGLAPKTIDSHLQHIYRKIGCRDRIELMSRHISMAIE